MVDWAGSVSLGDCALGGFGQVGLFVLARDAGLDPVGVVRSVARALLRREGARDLPADFAAELRYRDLLREAGAWFAGVRHRPVSLGGGS